MKNVILNMRLTFYLALLILGVLSLSLCEAFSNVQRWNTLQSEWSGTILGLTSRHAKEEIHVEEHVVPVSRRKFLGCGVGLSTFLVLESNNGNMICSPANAAETTSTSSTATVTDKIYLDIKGVPEPNAGEEGTTSVPSASSTTRIVIGLFGNDSPQPVSILKQLVSTQGYPSKCKPRETRTLQREQLEANKVYNSCIESESKGVTYDLSQIWRVAKDLRIDVGSVSGKFIAREYPTFEDSGTSKSLKHDSPGIVSVRRGNDGGFGFTIYPGKGDASALDEDNIVVGKVLEGMDVVERINEIPVVQASKLNYKALSGGDKMRAAPSRACRYGSSDLYCSEFKPLKKLLITSTGNL